MPPRAAQALVESNISWLVAESVQQLSSCMAADRALGARILQSVVAFGWAAAAPHLAALVGACISAAADDSAQVAKRGVAAAHIIGARLPPQEWMRPGRDAVVNALSLGAATCALVVLSALTWAAGHVSGSAQDGAVKLATDALLSAAWPCSNALRRDQAGAPLAAAAHSKEDAFYGAREDVRSAGEWEHGVPRPFCEQLLVAIATVLHWVGPGCVSSASRLLRLLLWLAEVERRQHGRDLAFSKTPVPYQERPPGIPSADAVLLDLAEACSLASVQDLCDCHAVSLLEDGLLEPAGWGLSSPGWLATCALLRRVSADGLRGAWPTLSGSLLGVASSQDHEPRLRLDVMELLDALLEVSR